jgi:hypothetical protein
MSLTTEPAWPVEESRLSPVSWQSPRERASSTIAEGTRAEKNSDVGSWDRKIICGSVWRIAPPSLADASWLGRLARWLRRSSGTTRYTRLASADGTVFARGTLATRAKEFACSPERAIARPVSVSSVAHGRHTSMHIPTR